MRCAVGLGHAQAVAGNVDVYHDDDDDDEGDGDDDADDDALTTVYVFDDDVGADVAM